MTKTSLALAAVLLAAAVAGAQTPKPYPEPPLTTWAPAGCRDVPFTDAATPPGTVWGNLHGNLLASDEVSHALAPVFAEAWTAEAATFNVTGPVFDRAGHLYFAPLFPHENVVLVSLSAATGQRRWAIAGTGAPPGGSAPLVLRDPDVPDADIVYLALKDRVIAVRADGTLLWDVPTGLALDPLRRNNSVLGTNYLPTADAIVGLSRDGWIFAVDRRTGAPILNAPFQLPGERTPLGPPIAAPPAVVTAAEDLLQTLADVPDGGLPDLIQVLLGNDSEVANLFSVDPRTGRLWVGGTAPDAEDGAADGVSQLGALFRLELVPNGSRYDVVEVCHRAFAGGTASTPTLNRSGSRIYLGDNFGKLLAIRDDCSDAWEVDLGSQIVGSVSVAADRREIYASTVGAVFKVIDGDGAGTLAWSAAIDPFEGLSPGQSNFNLNLVTAASNGLAFQGGAGLALSTLLPAAVGVGILDRETGTIRSFVAGGEETVAVMSVGPDGALYIGNSPVRRLFAHALGLSPAPIRGGITKFAPQRLDLLARDASCAGERRAANALAVYASCAESARADLVQLGELTAQTRVALGGAVTAGDVEPRRAARLERRLARLAGQLAAATADPATTALRRGLRQASRTLRRGCRTMDPSA